MRCHPSPENLGFAAAINRLAAASTAPFLLWFNPDAVVEGTAPVLDTLEAWLVAHPTVGCVGPRVLNEDGSVQASARRFPSWSTALGGRSTWLTRRFPNNMLSRHNLPARAADSPVTVDWLAGSCVMTRRDLFARLGGLDEGFSVLGRRGLLPARRDARIDLHVPAGRLGPSRRGPVLVADTGHGHPGVLRERVPDAPEVRRTGWPMSGPRGAVRAVGQGRVAGGPCAAAGGARGPDQGSTGMIVIVGGGVIGLAIARELALAGEPVVVLERHARCGLETSTHNSGVIHAGLYYPEGSLKGRSCVEGRDCLYAYCEAAAVPHVRCGKLVVAQAGEEGELERVAGLARAAGARVEFVDAAFVAVREPHVKAHGALWSPDTGWVEAEALVRAFEADVQRHDGIVLVGSPVVGIEPGPAGLEVVTPHERIEASLVINAAGLFADEVSRMAGGEPFRILSRAGRVRDAGAVGAASRGRPGLSRSACGRTRARHALHANAVGRGLARADGALSGRQAGL